MCGVCGWMKPSGIHVPALMRMNQLASHRGPDGEAYFLWDQHVGQGRFVRQEDAPGADLQPTLGFGHRRLAILDLSDAGLQPMSTCDGRIWITFNGEIYNYLELRAELKRLGYSFHTGTDTEVILAAYQAWGTDCFRRFNGMWGLVIADLAKQKIIFSRDRLGVKPLYIWQDGAQLAFASEIKQFFALPGVEPVANMGAVIEFIDTGYEDPGASFFDGIRSVPAGHWGAVPIGKPGDIVFSSFWDPEQASVMPITRREAVERARMIFEESVKLRLRSDVPVGVCLSGGVDSSAIFAQMHRFMHGSQGNITAFSAAYENGEFNERPFVDIVIRRLGGKVFYTHTTGEAFLSSMDKFVFHHDEPPNSLNIFASWSVMELARQYDTPVLLNGQGGDELFSGYWPAYYMYLKQIMLRRPMQFVRHFIGAMMPGGNAELLCQIGPHFRQYRSRKARDNRRVLRDTWRFHGLSGKINWAEEAQKIKPAQYRLKEIRHIHLPRLLKWEDRNSMAFGIEGRYPFLDYRMLEWAMAIPPELNFDRGWNKRILRDACRDMLPEEIRWRKSKIGFVSPQSEWVRTSLRVALEKWLDEPSDAMRVIVDGDALQPLRAVLHAQHIHRMDERMFLLLRLFLLDRWFKIFKVAIRSADP